MLPTLRLAGAVLLLLLVAPAAGSAQNAPGTDGPLMSGASLTCPGSPPQALFDPPTTSSVSPDGFRAGEHFRENTSPAAEVKIMWLGATFGRRFAAKIENDTTHAAYRSFVLRQPARGDQIVAALGDRHETTLAGLWCLLRLQPAGEMGALLTTAVPNLLFIRDAGGALWTVDAVWGGAGWEIGASAIDADRPWQAGALVISR